MTISKIFLFLCLSFVCGIFISSLGFLPGSRELLLLPGLILGVLLISVFWQKKRLVIVGFCLLFFVLGVWRHQFVISNIPEIQEGDITFTGLVSQEPDVRETNTKLTLSRVLVTTSRYPEYHYNDKLKITGKLEVPGVFEDFNYQDYLKKDGIYSVMYYPKIELVETNQGNFIYVKILQFKDKLREVIYQNLSAPQSSILGAVVLGDKSRMSDSLKEKLNKAGVRHITAVSGMHIVILSGILMQLGLILRLSRSRAIYSAIFLIALFIIMVGMPASAVRAGIMAAFYLLAILAGRPQASMRAVVFAVTFMLAFNPLLLKSDVGFQLSFLAVIGIIYLTPHFQRWLKFRILSMTLAAQVFTSPVLIYNFGYVPLAAPLTNILIVPLLPFLMGLGLVFTLIGLVFQPLAWVVSWPVWLLLTYIIKIVEIFSK